MLRPPSPAPASAPPAVRTAPSPTASAAASAVAQLLYVGVEVAGGRGCLEHHRRLTDLRHGRPRVQLLLLGLIRLSAPPSTSGMPLQARIIVAVGRVAADLVIP